MKYKKSSSANLCSNWDVNDNNYVMHSSYADACHFDVKNKEIRASVMSPPLYNFLRSTNGLTARILFDLRGRMHISGA